MEVAYTTVCAYQERSAEGIINYMHKQQQTDMKVGRFELIEGSK